MKKRDILTIFMQLITLLTITGLASYLVTDLNYKQERRLLESEQQNKVQTISNDFLNDIILSDYNIIANVNDIFDNYFYNDSDLFNDKLIKAIEESTILSAVFYAEDGSSHGIFFDGRDYEDANEKSLDLKTISDFKNYDTFLYQVSEFKNYEFTNEKIKEKNKFDEYVLEYTSLKYQDDQLVGYYVVSISVTEKLMNLGTPQFDYEKSYLVSKNGTIVNHDEKQFNFTINPASIYQEFETYTITEINSEETHFNLDYILSSRAITINNATLEALKIKLPDEEYKIVTVYDFYHPKTKFYVYNYTINLAETIEIQAIILLSAFYVFLSKVYRLIRETGYLNRLRTRSERDSLTGLFNRDYSFRYLKSLVKANGNVSPFSVAFIDVNGLKEINDNTGHKGGDELLRKVSYVLKSENRSNHLLARIGGDEFLVIAKNTSTADLQKYFNRVTEVFNEINSSTKFDFYLSISFGIKESIEYLDEYSNCHKSFEKNHYIDNLLQAADNLMYENKKVLKSISPSVIKSSIYVDKYKNLLRSFNKYKDLGSLINEINDKFDRDSVNYYISNTEGKIVFPRDLDERSVPTDVLVHTETKSDVYIENRFSHKSKKEYCVIDKRVMFESKNYAYVTVVLERNFASDIEVILSEVEENNVFEEMYNFDNPDNYSSVVSNALKTVGESFESKYVYLYRFDDNQRYAHLMAEYDPKGKASKHEIIDLEDIPVLSAHLRTHEIAKIDNIDSIKQSDKFLIKSFKRHKFSRAILFPIIEKEFVTGFVIIYDMSQSKTSVRQDFQQLAKLVQSFNKAYNLSQRVMTYDFNQDVLSNIISDVTEGILVLVDDRVKFMNKEFEELFAIDSLVSKDVLSRINKSIKKEIFEKNYSLIKSKKEISFNFKKSKLSPRKGNYQFNMELIESENILGKTVVCKVIKKK